MKCVGQKLLLISLGAAALMTSACAVNREGSYAVQTSALHSDSSLYIDPAPASGQTTAFDVAAVDAEAAALNGIESAAGPDFLDAENALALAGCDYSARFEEGDKLGWRWGEDNNSRLGLNFGSGGGSSSGGHGLSFGYSFKFPAPSSPKNGC